MGTGLGARFALVGIWEGAKGRQEYVGSDNVTLCYLIVLGRGGDALRLVATPAV